MDSGQYGCFKHPTDAWTLPVAAFKGRPPVAPHSAAALQGQLEARMWAAADAAVLVRFLRTNCTCCICRTPKRRAAITYRPCHAMSWFVPSCNGGSVRHRSCMFPTGCCWCCARCLRSTARGICAAERLPAAAQRHTGGGAAHSRREAGAWDAGWQCGVCLAPDQCLSHPHEVQRAHSAC